MEVELTCEQETYFQDLFRSARAKALNNSENFGDLVFALEKLGSYLSPRKNKLSEYKTNIKKIAEKSDLAEIIPNKFPEFHTDFDSLFELVRDERNSAMHEGVFARHITHQAIEISLIIEDAFMKEDGKVKDFMIRNPVCAFEWQPISFIRQNMLANSFSYLPIYFENEWRLISDFAITKYLHNSTSRTQRNKKLGQTFKDSGIEPIKTKTVNALDEIKAIISDWDGLPMCVTLQNSKDEIVGILTPFDLL